MSVIPSKKPVVPKQEKGEKSDTAHSIKLKTEEQAKSFFSVVKNRLLNVTDWDKLSGTGAANFALTDVKGNLVKRPVKKGDHIRINIPGPGSKAGRGFDWVKIEIVENLHEPLKDYEALYIQVRPAKNPRENSDEVAHFFKDDATSTFIVSREANTVNAEVHGRNEIPNLKETNKLDKIRNAVTAIGAMLGLSKTQWTFLVKGLVSEN